MNTHRRSVVFLKALALTTALCVVVTAQTRKTFEVVSVHPEVPPGPVSTKFLGERFEALGARPWDLIARAFGVDAVRVVTPNWTKLEAFNIKAVLPAGATAADVPEMLQTLLVQRFGLKVHIEKRPFPVYELVVVPTGSKLVEVAAANDLKKQFKGPKPPASDTTRGRPGEEVRQIIGPDARDRPTTRVITTRTSYAMVQLESGATELDAERMTIADFIGHMRVRTDRFIVDKTGLIGLYRFKTVLPPPQLSQAMASVLGDRVSTDPAGVSLPRSLAELGLKLEPKESLSDFVIVDSIERPTEN
jgi:uncharacterized protein (TIGR03435 family)